MIRKSVFGSRSEKELFTSLHTQWGSKFDLWPSLPFAQIIDVATLGHKIGSAPILFGTIFEYTQIVIVCLIISIITNLHLTNYLHPLYQNCFLSF